ncbi:MAG: hypothetical protein V3U89_04705 [Methylophilaceae bacterium]
MLLTLLAVPFSGLLQLRKKSQQKRIKEYNNTLLDYIKKAENVHDKASLEQMARDEINESIVR